MDERTNVLLDPPLASKPRADPSHSGNNPAVAVTTPEGTITGIDTAREYVLMSDGDRYVGPGVVLCKKKHLKECIGIHSMNECGKC